ncbi:hypothetical protein INT48_000801 [Thamnidium elegans]|uniref:Uncharacterized protein n=1 Tax=Thamnidium elegans TaxID=101142 RepID=A0A8H7SWU9_9FUNG|nr:hypothetical protein INT48_000801 [Thamnidium elegans]
MTSSNNNNYAFEIRFVDDKIVQVFDIAAKRQNEGTGLPTEYLQEDVLKGQLRYSKLVGSTTSPTENLDEYQHQVTTKRSKNRRSIQRHTFFMMGGNVGGDSSSQHLILNDMPISPVMPLSPTMQMSPTLPVSPSSPVPSLQVSLSLPVSPTLQVVSPPPQRAVSPPIPTLPQTAMIIAMVDSNDYGSRMNIQQEEKMSSKKGACCIIQ